MPFFGVPQFAYKQQPFWGVGRLRLSCKGFAEPRVDKCIDSRLFCIHSRANFFAECVAKLQEY